MFLYNIYRHYLLYNNKSMDSNWVFLAAIIVIVLLMMWGVPCSAEPRVQETTTIITTPAGAPVAVVKTATAVAAAPVAKKDPLTPETVVMKKSYGFAPNKKDVPIERFAVGLPDSYEQIRSADGRCLGIDGGASGVELTLQPCTMIGGMQKWKATPSKKTGYLIQAQDSGMGKACLTFDSTGQAVVLPCTDGAAAQEWDILDSVQGAGKKARKLRNGQNLCLDVSDPFFSTYVTGTKCGGNSFQQWTF